LLYSEPWSIAGLACLVADWASLLEVFGVIDPSDSGKTLRKKIASSGGNYRLVENNYPIPHLGIEAILEEEEKEWVNYSGSLAEIPTGRPRTHRPLVLQGWVLFAYGIFLSGILTMVLIYRWSRILDYEKFMSGQGTRVRLFMLCVGIITRSLWEPIEKGMLPKSHTSSPTADHILVIEVRHLEVFRKLSRGHQSPEATILTDYPRDIPVVGELKALSRGDFYMAFVGFVGTLIEAFVVSIPGVPFEPSQTNQSFEVSTWLSVSVLTLVLFAVILVFFRRRSACMPRLPYSIATVVVYLYAARMLRNLVGLSMLSTKERNKKIAGMEQTYGFGWTTSVDGNIRVGVDEEELYDFYNYPS